MMKDVHIAFTILIPVLKRNLSLINANSLQVCELIGIHIALLEVGLKENIYHPLPSQVIAKSGPKCSLF